MCRPHGPRLGCAAPVTRRRGDRVADQLRGNFRADQEARESADASVKVFGAAFHFAIGISL